MPSLPAKLTYFAALAIFFLYIFLPESVSAGDLIAQINQYRTSKGLYPVRTNASTCSFAQVRAGEISSGFSHNGFYSRVSSRTIPYQRYKLVTENLAWAPGGQNPVDMWINSPSHAANMLKNTPYVCIARQGDYYAYEGLTI